MAERFSQRFEALNQMEDKDQAFVDTEGQVSVKTAVGDQHPDPRYAWYVVGVLTFLYMVSFIDRMIINLLIPAIQKDLLISDTDISLIIGFAFALFYVLFGLPAGRLADLSNRRNLVIVGVALWSIMTAGSGLARSYWQLFLARVGVGVGEATLSPASYSLISDYFPPRRLATAMSVYAMAMNLGAGLALLIGGAAIAAISGMPEMSLPVLGVMRPWQLTFLLVGLLGIPATLLMATVTEPKRASLQQVAMTNNVVEVLPVRQVVEYMLSRKRLYGAVICTFSMTGILTYGLSAWLPTLLIRVHGWSASDVGLYLGLVVLFAGTTGTLAGGWVADWLLARGCADAKIRTAMVALCVATPLGVVAPLMHSGEGVLLLMIPAWFFICAPLALGVSVLQEITPNRMRGQVSALYLLVVTLCGIGLGPFAVGILTDYLFANPNLLNRSLSVLVAVAGPLGGLMLLYARDPYLLAVRSQ
jgi:MFS family permease